MNIYIHNTLSHKKEVFEPQSAGKVSMYHCGPTVYDFAHIGNLRSYVFADILRRTFEYNSYQVKQIINITDIGHLVNDGDDGEDKMTKALKREGKNLDLTSMINIGTKYFDAFVADLQSLNIETPTKFPRASDHIEEDIEIIKLLESKGFAYKTSDGLYFDTSKFPKYGKLGNIRMNTENDRARITSNPDKRNPIDFSLWKFDSKIGWESPWGKGFPGWHIECSAMSKKYLGQPFDIHTGGIDHIPVHHNNEIAQSEAAFDGPLATYWMHNEFMNASNEKMGKSKGNFFKLSELLDQAISPLSYRYWLLTAHYRSPVNFTFEAVHGAQNALIRLMKTVVSYPKGGKVISEYKEKFLTCINDDLNTASALALAWELVADANVSGEDKRATIIDFDRVFGLKLDSVPEIAEDNSPVPAEITALKEARDEARKSKDWAKADALRKEIEDRGFEVFDGKDGTTDVRPY